MYDHIICNDAFSKGHGLLKDLERTLSESEVRDLELLGYIENAISPNGETWMLTKKGRKCRKLLMSRNSLSDCIKDWIYIKVLGLNVNL